MWLMEVCVLMVVGFFLAVKDIIVGLLLKLGGFCLGRLLDRVVVNPRLWLVSL